MHRIGGLEKSEPSGAISYEAENHAQMVAIRAQKVEGIKTQMDAVQWVGPDQGTLLVITWGSTYGAVRTAVEAMQNNGFAVSALLTRVLYPLPPVIDDAVKAFDKVVVVELNSGQLCQVIRAKTLVDAQPITQITGKPFHVDVLIERLAAVYEEAKNDA
jgi:2-oxoglutarate ferredoxin oxidoreductase subunit alpha